MRLGLLGACVRGDVDAAALGVVVDHVVVVVPEHVLWRRWALGEGGKGISSWVKQRINVGKGFYLYTEMYVYVHESMIMCLEVVCIYTLHTHTHTQICIYTHLCIYR